MKTFVLSAQFLTKFGNLQHTSYTVEAENEFVAQTKGFSLISSFISNHNKDNPDDGIVNTVSRIQYKANVR
jgi:hypothetical protein